MNDFFKIAPCNSDQFSYGDIHTIFIDLITWFNEKSSFKINSSVESIEAFRNYILMKDYFKSGSGEIELGFKNKQ